MNFKKEFPEELWWIIFLVIFLLILLLFFTLRIFNFTLFQSKSTMPLPPYIRDSSKIESSLIKDLVCGKILNPNELHYKAIYLDHIFYFDTKECQDKFNRNPLKYLPVQIKLKIKVNQPGIPINTPKIIPTAPLDKSSTAPTPELTIEDLPDKGNNNNDIIEIVPESPQPEITKEID